MKKILVAGGAGYIGSVLVRLLLQHQYKVRVLDNLNFGGETLIELWNNPDFDFIKGDIRDNEILNKAIEGMDVIVNLAAVVGDPACAKNPELAKETNFEAPKSMYQIAESKNVKQFIFASTCSNYGKMEDPDGLVNENSLLAPVSLYAETKVATEQFLLSQPRKNICKPTCLRFSTAYGLSPRTRFDLTVNEFTKELALGRELVVFGEQFWRPYCHVVDLARSIETVINSAPAEVAFEVFNVGDTRENYTKKLIIEEIVKQLPESIVKFVQKIEDPRDYKVSFEKIGNKLHYKISKTVPEGIDQVIKIIKYGFLEEPDSIKYKNS